VRSRLIVGRLIERQGLRFVITGLGSRGDDGGDRRAMTPVRREAEEDWN
jgi:hypothetical protein